MEGFNLIQREPITQSEHDPREQMEHNLLTFVDAMKNVKKAEKLIDEIFQIHFHFTSEKTLILDLYEHISTIFKIDANLLLHYLGATGLMLDSSDSKVLYINNLKARYGLIIAKLLNRQASPFLITGAEMNVQDGGSIHKLSLTRNDQTTLEGQFNPATMLNILSVLTNGTAQSISRGIYNLREDEINNYIRASDHLLSTLKNLLDSQKN